MLTSELSVGGVDCHERTLLHFCCQGVATLSKTFRLILLLRS